MSKKASRELRPGDQSKIVTSYCIAEQYDLERVSLILLKQGYVLDPLRTGLYPQVIHIELPIDFEDVRSVLTNAVDSRSGDVFIFPSGTLVAWGVPEATVSAFTSNFISATTVNPHLEPVETEDLEYIEDPAREISSIKGDTIIIGTKVSTTENETGSKDSLSVDGSATNSSYAPSSGRSVRHVNTVLAKIAFSSGLARSTKLAVLESLLNDYFESTRSIPTMLSRGSRLPFTRSFVLQKTGQLLSVRAQLNLYSELTDSLPDLFWDSRHELGLEGYYDQVGRALDCGIRVKTLNDKMDHAQEIASVLREQLSEQHSLRLEWIIILLIAVEVGFEIRREWRERKEHKS
ncbi:MAG: hypothetical protein MMC33_004988 [Icmadophila ericetorum]|nr:hypothetical protein [Icmadophila ericetorum]